MPATELAENARQMKSTKVLMRVRALCALLLASLLAACGDMPTGPRGSVAASAVGSLGASRSQQEVALFACETPDFGSVTRRIGPEGGLIGIGPHALLVPPGALATSVDITASAPASPHVRVTFSPHGLEFTRRAVLILSYKHCGPPAPRRPRIAYIDPAEASILELLPSWNNKYKRAVSTTLEHFSGYAIAD
jgi:hypothetical protein